MRAGTCIVAALLLGAVGRSDVLFYASYDEGKAAGKLGAARAFSAPAAYPAAGYISAQAGTVAFWFQSQWSPADGKHHPLFDWLGTSHGYSRILIYKYATGNTIYFGLRSREGTEATRKVTCTASTEGWQPGEWHHVVATWDGSAPEARLYVDGCLAGKRETRWDLGNMPDRFLVGSAGTTMDELMIFGRALSAKEARALWASYLPSAVQNSRFEAELGKGWQGGTRTQPGRDGGHCLRVAPGAAAVVELGVEPGKLYEVGYWAKVDASGSLKARIGFSTDRQGVVRHTLDGPTDWQRCAFAFVAPPHAKSARLSFAASARSAYVDDVDVVPSPDIYANLLRHSSFEHGDGDRPAQYWCRFLDYLRHDDRCGRLDDSVAFHGAKSLHLAPGQSYSFWKELREVDHGYRAKYRFTYAIWLKAEAEGGSATLGVNGWAEDNWNRSHFKESTVGVSRRWTRHELKVEVESGLLEVVIRNAGKCTIWADAAQLCQGWDLRTYCDAYYGSHGEGLWEKRVDSKLDRQLPSRRPRAVFRGSRNGTVPLTVRNEMDVVREAWPVRVGVPFPSGTIGEAKQARLSDARGRPILCQKRVLARWLDGSIMSLLLDFPAHVPAAGASEYVLSYGTAASETTAPAMKLPTERLFTLKVVDDFGTSHDATGPGESVSVEESGPVRSVVAASGHCMSKSGDKLLGYAARVSAWRGKTFVRLDLTLKNDVLAMNTAIREASVTIPWPQVRRLRAQGDGGNVSCAVGRGDGAVRVMQVRRIEKSSGCFQDPAHSYVVDRPSGEVLARGRRHAGFFELEGRERLLVAVKDFWQRHPQEVVVSPDGIEVFLWPRDEVRRLDLSVGVSKTMTLFLDLAPPAGDLERLRAHADALRRAPLVTCPASWYCQSGALGGTYLPEDRERYPIYEWYLSDFFARKMDYPEVADLTGAFDYGDDIKSGLAGWHNNQTMFAHHLLVQYARTLEPRYWHTASRLLRHMADSDIPCARVARQDFVGSVASPGSFVHTDKFPSSSHNWSEGALDYYLLSGEPWALDVAKGICDYLSEYHLRILSSGSTKAPYRNHGWTLMQVCRLYEVTGEPRYLQCAQELADFLCKAADPQDGWPGTGRSVFHGGTCCAGLWRYADLTGDAADRDVALKMTEWLYSIQPEGVHKEYPWTWRETVFFGPLARAYEATGKVDYVGTAFEHTYAGFDRGLLWTTAPFTTQLMPYAAKLGLKEPHATRPHLFKALFDHSVHVREDDDREFELQLIAVRPRGGEPPTIVGYGPRGKPVVEWRGPSPQTHRKRTYETFSLRVPKDGATGTYRFDVKTKSMWTLSYRCDLPKLVVKGGAYGQRCERFFFSVPNGTKEFRVSANGFWAKPRHRCGVEVLGPSGARRGHVVWWKIARERGPNGEPHVLTIRPTSDEIGKVWCLRTSNTPYLTLEGVPPYLAKRREACFVPD